MKRKSFTLIEILIALIILSILASLSVAVYQKTVDANNERICAQNLKVLQAAIDIYTVENDALPAALSLLTPRQIYLAYSRVAGKRKENPFSIALRKMFSTEPAIAGGEIFISRYLAGNIKVFCDPTVNGCTPPSVGGCNSPAFPPGGIFQCGSSYNFNFTTATFDTTTRRLNTTTALALIQDTGLRHKGKFGSIPYALGVTPGGRVGKVGTGGDIIQFLEPLGGS